MHRFKITERETNIFWLAGSERDHLVRVLRLTSGDRVIGFDNTGGEWVGEVATIEDSKVACRILEENHPDVEARARVYLVTGLPKGEKMEWVIQKGTELGMSGLIPLRAKRAVVRLEGDKAKERVQRWQKIAAEAAKQCRRVREPLIERVCDWSELASILPYDTQWVIPYEEEKTVGLQAALKEMNPERPLAILIGPEGGFDNSEVNWAINKLAARPVSLGPRILRAETAALAALTMSLAYWGDLG